MIKIRSKKFVFLGALLLATMGVGAILFQWGFRLQWAQFTHQMELRTQGVQSVSSQGIHAYVKDGCSQKKFIQPGVDPCSCVAFIHGLGDQALTWKKILSLTPEQWRAQGYPHPLRLVAVDLPGVGRSERPAVESDYRVRNQAHLIRGVLQQSCSAWVVVGNSLGGWIASWLALDWPEGVSRLVLLSPSGLKEASQSSMRAALTHPTVESLKEFQKKAYFRPREIPDSVWERIAQEAKAGNAAQVVQAQQDEDYLDAKLGLIRQPTVLLWGKEDHILPIELGRKMREVLKRNVIWREVNECGHLPQKECPEAVTRSIIELISFGSV